MPVHSVDRLDRGRRPPPTRGRPPDLSRRPTAAVDTSDHEVVCLSLPRPYSRWQTARHLRHRAATPDERLSVLRCATVRSEAASCAARPWPPWRTLPLWVRIFDVPVPGLMRPREPYAAVPPDTPDYPVRQGAPSTGLVEHGERASCHLGGKHAGVTGACQPSTLTGLGRRRERAIWPGRECANMSPRSSMPAGHPYWPRTSPRTSDLAWARVRWHVLAVAGARRVEDPRVFRSRGLAPRYRPLRSFV
jgi:hypothetical protein